MQHTSRLVGTLPLGVIAIAAPLVSVQTYLSSDSSSLLFIAFGTAFPLLVSFTVLVYLGRARSRQYGDELLTYSSVGSLLGGLLFAFTARSIIWGQRTLDIVMADQLILTSQMGLGGALFGLLIGHYFGLSRLQHRRLDHQTEQLSRQNQRLDEFASIVSHDLRSPLNVIAGRLELATRDVENEHLDSAVVACNRMGELIEDLMELARSDGSDRELLPTDLDDVVQRAWNQVPSKEATLVVETELAIVADRGRLQQLLENLFRNAVEHGGDDVTITIGELDDGFYVDDNGPGIPSEYRDDVFTRGFSTADDGTGFGLAIVAEIVRAHDWDFALTEAPSGGTRFEITGIETNTRE